MTVSVSGCEAPISGEVGAEAEAGANWWLGCGERLQLPVPPTPLLRQLPSPSNPFRPVSPFSRGELLPLPLPLSFWAVRHRLRARYRWGVRWCLVGLLCTGVIACIECIECRDDNGLTRADFADDDDNDDIDEDFDAFDAFDTFDTFDDFEEEARLALPLPEPAPVPFEFEREDSEVVRERALGVV